MNHLRLLLADAPRLSFYGYEASEEDAVGQRELTFTERFLTDVNISARYLSSFTTISTPWLESTVARDQIVGTLGRPRLSHGAVIGAALVLGIPSFEWHGQLKLGLSSRETRWVDAACGPKELGDPPRRRFTRKPPGWDDFVAFGNELSR